VYEIAKAQSDRPHLTKGNWPLTRSDDGAQTNSHDCKKYSNAKLLSLDEI